VALRDAASGRQPAHGIRSQPAEPADGSRTIKVAVVGGAGWFAIDLIRHIYKEQLPIELSLFDVNAEKLDALDSALGLINSATGRNLRFRLCSSVHEALDNADHVISTFCVDHVLSRASDMAVCARYGVHPCEGETASPGGLMNTIRHLPILLDLCREMEEICPDALLHILNNPLNRLCYGVSTRSAIRAIGYCDGLEHTLNEIAPAIGREPDDLAVVAAGVNHLTFILKLYDRATGENLEPLLGSRLDRVNQVGPFGFRFSKLVYQLLGYYPCPGDNHIADQLPFVSDEMKRSMPIESLDVIFPPLDVVRAGESPQQRDVLDLPGYLQRNPAAVARFVDPPGREEVAEVILAWEGLAPPLQIQSMNMPNRGLIPNLPFECVVELPGLITQGGAVGLSIGPLPTPLAELCGRMARAHCSAVEAVANADRETALQSIAYEPTVRDLTVIEDLLDDLLEVNVDYMSPALYAGLRNPTQRGRLVPSPPGSDEKTEQSRYQTGLLQRL
jgi:alpha-galactosidase